MEIGSIKLSTQPRRITLETSDLKTSVKADALDTAITEGLAHEHVVEKFELLIKKLNEFHGKYLA